MQTLDQNLKTLLASGIVAKDEAQRKAANPEAL
jgi:Tfp pilus assembly ATPase PilU